MSEVEKQISRIDEGQKPIAQLFVDASKVVYKTYLKDLHKMEVVPCPDELTELKLENIAQFFRVERFVSEINENYRDKLVSVFNAVANCGGSVIILINSDGEKIGYYFGTKTLDEQNPKILNNSRDALEKTLKGNFPGTKIKRVRVGNEIDGLLDSVFRNKTHERQEKHICTITGVAGLRSKEETRENLFIQGMEKLVNAMQGETYSLLLIADPVSPEYLDSVRRGYEDIYSKLSPLAGYELSYGENESKNVSNSLTKGFSESLSKSITDSFTHTKGSSRSHTHSSSDTKTKRKHTHAESDSYTYGSFNSDSEGKSINIGETGVESIQNGKQEGAAQGKSKTIQVKFEGKTIKNLLEKLDLQMKRLDEGKDVGMWNCSVYCLADLESDCKIAASAYQSLLRGENSSIESGVITAWDKDKSDAILPYLKKMYHPTLSYNNDEITPVSLINTQELTIHAGIPQSNVSGLPVLQMAAFGREVSIHWDRVKKPNQGIGIELGSIYHMGNKENLQVFLDKKNLASHTFITGSTGSGKSNTIYHLLNKITEEDGNFLVIEPSKGEYKKIFGKNKDVFVYGTNPNLTSLLRINPFVFPNGNADSTKNIHILEHLDRLVEIFNVCWPMQMAMPAVLKEAIEAAYEQAGWDLLSSTNISGSVKYPTFADVASSIKQIIESSEYSSEVKGNYKGALITRLKTLANGINGVIFTNDDLSNEDLFDRNVIVDLSRAGSTDTKALIMGILVLKLQEHRMTSGLMNSELRHFTVLEEAHNILKRTSPEQSDESSNLLGKSVELLANSIAEMRTYGEGFIIADQSPGLLDMSVIRNTNTKIIMHLPDESDRVLVGKAAGLNDEQVMELAKLQCGVAAVYQKDWIQPVLCKMEEIEYDENFVYIKPDTAFQEKSRVLADLKRTLLQGKETKNLKEVFEKIDIDTFKMLKPEDAASLFPENEAVFLKASKDEQVRKSPDKAKELYDLLMQHLEPSLSGIDIAYRNHILTCIVSVNCKKDPSLSGFFPRWESFIKKNGGTL